MRDEERDVESASEESGVQEQIAAVAHRVADRVPWRGPTRSMVVYGPGWADYSRERDRAQRNQRE